MTPTPKDPDSFAGWSDADDLQVSCGTHRLHDCASVSFWTGGTTSEDTTSEQNRVHEVTSALHPRHTDARATPHMTPTPKDPDSFAGSWSCAGHTISTSGHLWSFWPGDRWRHVFGSRSHFYALSAIRIRRPSCCNVRAFPECSNDWLPRARWNTHARWAAMLVSNHPISPPCH